MAKTNVKARAPRVRTHEGATSPQVSSVRQLRRSVMACMLWEDEFYEDGKTIAERIRELVAKVAFKDAVQCAIDAREKFKLRHVPLLVLREIIRTHRTEGRAIGDLVTRIIQRPDEITELLSIYWRDDPAQPLSSQLKLGIARSFHKFRDYALAKYDRSQVAVQLRDAAFLSHVRAADHPMGVRIARLVNRTFYPEATKSAKFPVRQVYELGEYEALDTPDTWETNLSAGADKKETFTRLLAEHKMGALALLRNLRNMVQAGVDGDAIRRGIDEMKTERVLPFRFLTAARYAKQFEPQLEAAMFRCLAASSLMLSGKTAILIDHSGSMDAKVSTKSELMRLDAAAAVGVILREVCAQVRVFAFSDWIAEVPPRRGFALIDAIRGAGRSGGTYLGAAINQLYAVYPDCERLIVITDEQSADRPVQPHGRGYIVNVGSAQNGIAYGSWIAIDGWSEAVIDFIREYETETPN